MEFINILALRGPNLWAYSPVIEALVDLGKWKDTASDSIPGFNDRLMSWLPTMIEHRCSEGVRGGFFERLQGGTYFAHILEHVTLELQNLAGVPVGYGRARESSKEGVFKVVFKYKDETLARACLHEARELILAAAEDRPYDVSAAVTRLRAVAKDNLPGAGLDAILEAAKARGIPAALLDRNGLIQLGQGVKQRRLRSAQTDQAGAIAQSVAEDRDLTHRLLQAAGIPCVPGYSVDGPEDAWETAEYVGLPVTVRPQFDSSGRGVTRNLASRDEILAAYATARAEARSIMVESYVAGYDYKLLVIGDSVAAAATRDRDSGAPVDVTALVHPATAEHAVRTAKVIGMDIAAVDVITDDIRRPLESQGGVIGEVHASPPLDIFCETSPERAQEIGGALVTLLYPAGENGRIPVAAVTGTNGKTTVTRVLAHILRGTGVRVGMSCTDGVYLDERRITKGDCSGPASARNVLMNPAVEVAVCETARGGILRAGLAFNVCDAAIVTNIGGGDHLGINDVNTPEQLAKVKRGIVEVVPPGGTAVLNAADPQVAGMAKYSKGSVLFFALSPDHDVIAEHRRSGGRALFVSEGNIVLAEGDRETRLMPVAAIPMTLGGRIGFEIENALAAIGGALALGVAHEVIVERASNFFPDIGNVPTRFNVIEKDGATVVVDFGHNPDALRAVIEALDTFPQKRRVAAYSSAGDRRDEDIRLMGEMLGNAFDRVILYEDTDLYKRAKGDIIALMREGLAKGTRVAEIEEIEGGLNAFKHAWTTVQPGELMLAQAHTADPTVEYLKKVKG